MESIPFKFYRKNRHLGKTSLLYLTVLLISKELFEVNERRPGAPIGADGGRGVGEAVARLCEPQLMGKDCRCLSHISKGAHIHHDAEEH